MTTMKAANRSGKRRVGAGFTLIELMATIIVLGLIAGIVAPLAVNASDAYSTATSQRTAVERAAFAMDKCLGLVRAGPEDAPGSYMPAITLATPTAVGFADGRKLELLGSVLWATDPAQPGGASPLCGDVTAFSLRYVGADGVTDTADSPLDTVRIEVLIAVGGVSLRSTALVRCAGVMP